MRRTARLLMQFLPAPTSSPRLLGGAQLRQHVRRFNEDAEDFDDYNVIQRDLKVDGGLRPVREET